MVVFVNTDKATEKIKVRFFWVDNENYSFSVLTCALVKGGDCVEKILKRARRRRDRPECK